MLTQVFRYFYSKIFLAEIKKNIFDKRNLKKKGWKLWLKKCKIKQDFTIFLKRYSSLFLSKLFSFMIKIFIEEFYKCPLPRFFCPIFYKKHFYFLRDWAKTKKIMLLKKILLYLCFNHKKKSHFIQIKFDQMFSERVSD